VLIDINVMII